MATKIYIWLNQAFDEWLITTTSASTTVNKTATAALCCWFILVLRWIVGGSIIEYTIVESNVFINLSQQKECETESTLKIDDFHLYSTPIHRGIE